MILVPHGLLKLESCGSKVASAAKDKILEWANDPQVAGFMHMLQLLTPKTYVCWNQHAIKLVLRSYSRSKPIKTAIYCKSKWLQEAEDASVVELNCSYEGSRPSSCFPNLRRQIFADFSHHVVGHGSGPSTWVWFSFFVPLVNPPHWCVWKWGYSHSIAILIGNVTISRVDLGCTHVQTNPC